MRDTATRRTRPVPPKPPLPHAGVTTNLSQTDFDHAQKIAAAQSFADLEAAMRPAAEVLGFTDFMVLERTSSATRIVVGSPANGYIRGTSTSNDDPMRNDIILRVCLTATDAFFYSDVLASHPLTETDQQILAQRFAHGIHEGFVGVRHRQGGVTTCVAMIGADVDATDPEVRAAAHLLSEYYGAAARRLLAAARERPAVPHLTQRQRDCLYWVGHGKSGADIAKILGISPHTVHAHVSDACARLGVRTRVQAVSAAVALGFIES